MKKLTDIQKLRAHELHKIDGHTMTKIADLWGVSHNTVSDAIKEVDSFLMQNGLYSQRGLSYPNGAFYKNISRNQNMN